MLLPEYSIIIPVYNAEKHIGACIDSILNQHFQQFEIIIIDDGSTDNSGVICDEYAKNDCRIHVIHKSNKGVSSARNAGIDKANGDYLVFIDSDDYIEQDYFPKEELSFDLYIQNKTTFGYCANESDNQFINTGNFIGKKKVIEFCRQYMHFDVLRAPWGKFFRREIIKKHNIRFDTDFKLGEDTLFCMEYIRFINSIRVLNTANYMYFRAFDDELWQRRYHISEDEAIKYLEIFYKKYKQLPASNIELLWIVYNLFYKIVIKSSYLETSPSGKWHDNKTIFSIKYDLGLMRGRRNRIKYMLYKTLFNC